MMLATALVFTGCASNQEVAEQIDTVATQEIVDQEQEAQQEEGQDVPIDEPWVTVDELQITDFQIKDGKYSFKLTNNTGYNISQLFIICGEREGDNATMYGNVSYIDGTTAYTVGDVENLNDTADQFLKEGATLEELDIALWMYNIVGEENDQFVWYTPSEERYEVENKFYDRIYGLDEEGEELEFDPDKLKMLEHSVEKKDDKTFLKVRVKNELPYGIYFNSYVCLAEERIRGGGGSSDIIIEANEEKDVLFELTEDYQIEDLTDNQVLEGVQPLDYYIGCIVEDKKEGKTKMYSVMRNVGEKSISISLQ